MKNATILSKVLFTTTLSFAATLIGCASVQAQCPDVSQHETALDCPWADASRATTGIDNLSQIRMILTQKIPGFVEQVEKDAKARDLLNLWSLSRNIDESNLSTGILTVPANIITFLNSILNVTYNAQSTEGHAGLTHTYGYLFSNAWTPFGYKRLRYVAGETEEGFGLPQGLFSGLPQTGTLLSNLTSFAAPIAFRDSPVSKGEFQDVVNSGLITNVPEIANYPYSNLKIKRLVEIVANEKYYLEMRTDIVNFPNPNTRGNNRAILIYSIDFRAPEQPARPRIVTVFPVDAGFATGLFNPTTLGTSVGLKLKYNAVLPVSIPAEEMVGKRFILNESTSN
jgi:hypothetical protein